MGFTFEEKFIFNNQNFVSCNFSLRVDDTLKSVCLIADRIGVLYSPTILENNVIYMRPFKLLEVRTRNLVITNIYPVQHNKQTYTFVACESTEGTGYCLLTYNISNLDTLNAETDLISCQTLDNHFKIMDLKSISDENGNSLIVLCGSDKRLHVYSLDAQCIIHRKKKTNFNTNQIVEKLLVESEYIDAYLGTALPLRLFLCRESVNFIISDALLGYSNGIIKWFHEVPPLTPPDSENDFIQEIPTYGGNNKGNTSFKIGELQKPSLPFRKNHSLGDLSSFLELNSVPVNAPSSTNKLLQGSENILNPIESEVASAPSEPEPLPDTEKVQEIRKKTLLFDGIVSCLCFYQIPLRRNSEDAHTPDNRNRNLQWLNLKPKKSQYLPCIAVGLASGSSLLICFDDTEDPITILSNSLKRGGALAMTLGNISSERYKDILIGFQDGTVTLLKYEGCSRFGIKPSHGKLSNVHFNLIWEIQLNCPILGLFFGPLMEVIDPRLRKKSARDNDLYKGNYYNNLPQVGNTTTSTEVSSDQLAIVTSKSFHFFSLSFTNTANTKKIVCVDRFVTKLV